MLQILLLLLLLFPFAPFVAEEDAGAEELERVEEELEGDDAGDDDEQTQPQVPAACHGRGGGPLLRACLCVHDCTDQQEARKLNRKSGCHCQRS